MSCIIITVRSRMSDHYYSGRGVSSWTRTVQGWRAAAGIGRGKASAGLLAMQHWRGCCSRVAWLRWVQACQAAAKADERAAGHCHTILRFGTSSCT